MKAKNRKKPAYPGKINFRLLLEVMVLAVVGILMVHSATSGDVTKSVVSTTVKQILGVAGGTLVMFLLMLADYKKVVKHFWIFYVAAFLGLLYVFFVAEAIYGAHRWIYIPLFGTIQPSEFAKPALLVTLAFICDRLKGRISKFWALLIYFAAAAPMVIFVLIEPDLSTTIVLAIMLVSVLFLSGISYKWVVGVMIAMIPLIIVFMYAVYQPDQTILKKLLEPHQVERINGFFFPEQYPATVYQQNNSVMAIGSGGFFGKGLNNSSLDSVKNGNFLSEESCDFIFAVVGEELGFFGSVLLIGLIALVVIECLIVSYKCQDLQGKIIAGAAGLTYGFQSMINIGVATLVIPNTGIPLPFISAGLSSLLSSFILMGLVQSVSLHGSRKKRVNY